MRMSISFWLLGSNPFFESYLHSDLLGKALFLSLILLSVGTWILLIYKVRVTFQARRAAATFRKAFREQRAAPLSLDYEEQSPAHPFLSLYLALREQTLDILDKNREFSPTKKGACLSPSDIELVGAHLSTTVSLETRDLERYLYLLSTIVSLGPFLGLLGTVWGILTSFSQLQAHGGTHALVLGGLSLALATTVLGLIDAIPALIGYNYLKNVIREFEVEMESFSHEILSSVELQYRQVDLV